MCQTWSENETFSQSNHVWVKYNKHVKSITLKKKKIPELSWMQYCRLKATKEDIFRDVKEINLMWPNCTHLSFCDFVQARPIVPGLSESLWREFTISHFGISVTLSFEAVDWELNTVIFFSLFPMVGGARVESDFILKENVFWWDMSYLAFLWGLQ